MEKYKHIAADEVIALIDRKWEMLPEFAQHAANCNECTKTIQRYTDMQSVLFSNRHISLFPDLEKIDRIAEMSFNVLHAEEKKEVFFAAKIADMISSYLKPIAITATAAALAVIVYTSNHNSNENTSAENEFSSEEAINTEKTPDMLSFKGLEKSGSTFKNKIASVETIDDTYLESVSENEIKMNSGKAKFDVVSGNDFRINVNNKFLVRVLGTSFVLKYDTANFTVKVLEGLVEVIRNDDSSTVALSANMEQLFPVSVAENVSNENAQLVKKSKKIIASSKLSITPDASFLVQGREALKSGNSGAAIQLFMLEMEKGAEKDKALFEAVRIHETKHGYQDAVNLILTHSEIIKSSKVYKEELLIKGCFSQYKMKSSDLSLCREYVESFPNGYRKNEIQEIINE